MAIRQLIKAAVDIDEGRALPNLGHPMIGKIIRRHEIPDTCFLQEVQVLLIISPKLIWQICALLPGSPVTDVDIQSLNYLLGCWALRLLIWCKQDRQVHCWG